MKRFFILCILGTFLFSALPVPSEAASFSQIVVKKLFNAFTNEYKENTKKTNDTTKTDKARSTSSPTDSDVHDPTQWVSIDSTNSYLKDWYISTGDIKEHNDPNAMPVRVKNIDNKKGTYSIKYILAFKDADYLRVEKTETYNLKSGQLLTTSPAYTDRLNSFNGPLVKKVFELQEIAAQEVEAEEKEAQEAKESSIIYTSIIGATLSLIIGGVVGAFIGRRKAKKSVLPLFILFLVANPIVHAEDWVKVPTYESHINMYIDADDIRKSSNNKAIEAAVKIEYPKTPGRFYMQNVLFLPNNLYLGVNNTTSTNTITNETKKLYKAGGFDGNKEFIYADLHKEAWRIRHEIDMAKAEEAAEKRQAEIQKNIYRLLGISLVSLLIGGGIGYSITSRRKKVQQ
ncbi:MAG: hypothetical protein SOY76_06340 [Veillonella caviae]|nr:hypothetical protein [Veillonella caviae]